MNISTDVNVNYILACNKMLQDLLLQKQSLQNQLDLGIIEMVDATQEVIMINSKELKIKKQLVNVVHVKTNGKLRSIKDHVPTSSYPNGYVYTKLEGGKLVKAKDLDTLYNRLYDYYFGKSNGFSVKEIFDKALEEKKKEENIKDETYGKYQRDFKYYISYDLAEKDIRQITFHDLKSYTQDLVHQLYLKEKAFLAYKTLLNLIFHYALNHSIINEDPVRMINNKQYLISCDTDIADADEKILSKEEIQGLIDEVERRRSYCRWGEYYIYGYAMKFSVQAGVRVGEICSLKWSDIDYQRYMIHIHSQQLKKSIDGKEIFYYAPYTKDELGKSRGGRYFPLTDYLKELLDELKELQKKLQINSEYVFCYKDGSWLNKLYYGKFFRRICKHQGLSVTNNHALRMSLNSNVLIPNNVSVADRAKLLGHSISTNQNHYSYNQKDYVENTREILNSNNDSNDESTNDLTVKSDQGTFSTQKGTFSTTIFAEKVKRKSPQTASLQAFSNLK